MSTALTMIGAALAAVPAFYGILKLWNKWFPSKTEAQREAEDELAIVHQAQAFKDTGRPQ